MPLFLITLFGLILRLYMLNEIPAEMWGDVIEHYKLATSIHQGDFFLDFRFGGDGPLFSYYLGIFTKIFGLSFYAMKLSAVVLGIALGIIIFFLANELFKNKKTAYIASFLSAVSFWSLIFSRIPVPHILIPIFTSLSIFFALRNKDFVAGVLVGLGMYIQVAFFGVIFIFLKKLKIFLTATTIAIFVVIHFVLRFGSLTSQETYFGEKLGLGEGFNPINFLFRIMGNFIENMLSFNLKGDSSFRFNIPNLPHLDPISGLFFAIGIILIVKKIIQKCDKKLFYYFLIPTFVIQIPSLLDVKNPMSTPNIARLAGLMPFAYMASSLGIYSFLKMIKKRVFRFPIAVTILGLIFYLNFYNYFYVYPKGLPNNNTPFGKIIAEEIDKYPLSTHIIIMGCCWGQGSDLTHLISS